MEKALAHFEAALRQIQTNNAQPDSGVVFNPFGLSRSQSEI